MTKTDSEYDVIVIGGGPAGSTVSTLLAQKGYKVLVVEKERFPRFHIGESLTYVSLKILEELKVLDKMERANWTKKFGLSFVDTMGLFKPFYFAEVNNKYIEDCFAYQVDRARWDKMLLDNCREHNVIVKEQHKVIDLLFNEQKVVGVQYQTYQGKIENACAQIVIDASGRNTFLANRFKMKIRHGEFNNQVIFTRVRGAKLPDDIDSGNLMIFKLNCRDWAWLTPLREDVQSVGVMIGGIGNGSQSFSPRTLFLESIKQNQDLADKLRHATIVDKIRMEDHYTYSTRQKVGPGYVLIGDAAGYIDPLFSSGISFAMNSAKYVADDLDYALRENNLSSASFSRYEEKMSNGFDAFHRLIQLWYKLSYRNFFYTFCQPENRPHFARLLAGYVFENRLTFIIEQMEQCLRISEGDKKAPD